MQQALTEWPGDLPSLIAEMKRRAGVQTDQELARFMDVAQSTVAGWRKRGAVPEAALLRFEVIEADPMHGERSRLFAAKTIALRLPELWYERFRSRNPLIGRRIFYAGFAMSLAGITAEIANQIKRIESEQALSTEEVSSLLFDDLQFLNGILDWLDAIPAADLLWRTKEARERTSDL